MTKTSRSKEASRWSAGRIVLATLTVVGVALCFYLAYRLRVVVFLALVAVVIGTAIRPLVNRLQARGVLRPVGVFAVYLLLALLVSGFMLMVVPLVVEQGSELAGNIPAYYETMRASMLESNSRILVNIALRLPLDLALFPAPEPTVEETLSQVSRFVILAGLVLKIFFGAIAVLLLGFYWALEGDRAVRNLLRALPHARAREVHILLDRAEHKVGGFIRGQGLLTLAVGTAALIAYTLIGLPYAVVLAVIAGIFELVPFFGPALGAIPAILVSLTYDPSTTIWVLIAVAAIQLLENAWLVPRIMNQSIGVNPILSLLALVTLTSVMGFPGAVLALPLAAIVQLVLERVTADAVGERIGVEAAGLHPVDREEMEAIARELELVQRDLQTEGTQG